MKSLIEQHLPALTYPLYLRYWLASFASVGATQLVTLGQGWLVFELTGSAWNLGLLGAAVALPNIFVTLVGGVIADRFNKRVIMMTTSVLTALMLALLAYLDWRESITLLQVLTIAAIVSLITGIEWPARVAIYPHLVDRDHVMNAVALNAVIWQATRMALPALGGIVIAFGDTWMLFAAGALGFFIMYLVMSGIRIHMPVANAQSPFGQLMEGLRFIRDSRLFTALLAITFAGMFFTSSFSQIMPIFADAIGGDERVYGYLLTTGGLAAVIGTAIASRYQHHPQLGQVMLATAILTAVSVLLFGWVSIAALLVPALVMTFLAQLFASIFTVTSMGVMQLSVPDELRGRVMGIHAIGYSLVPMGGLFLGGLTEWAGAGFALSVGCLIHIVIIVFAGYRQHLIRNWSGALASESATAADSR
ncbi:MAG: MFS transporter [Gammaproteobacteria bacterium]|nr:MFS transporter [Gammaproteobacteria bacterium]